MERKKSYMKNLDDLLFLLTLKYVGRLGIGSGRPLTKKA